MAEHHHETSLRLLKEWKSLIDKQAEAIATGDVQNLEKLIRQSSSIQHQLSQSLAASDKNAHGKKIARMLRELHHEQGCVIEALKAQAPGRRDRRVSDGHELHLGVHEAGGQGPPFHERAHLIQPVSRQRTRRTPMCPS
jgi:hypothetical protein